MANSLHFSGYDATIERLKAANLYPLLTTVINNRLAYYALLADSRMQFTLLVGGVLLGLLTSALLFNSMHVIYMEHFRRDLFIKRLSGLRFTESHRLYLLVQLVLFSLAGLVLSFIVSKPIIWLVTLGFFSSNAFYLLLRQEKKEEQFAVTILKGE